MGYVTSRQRHLGHTYYTFGLNPPLNEPVLVVRFLDSSQLQNLEGYRCGSYRHPDSRQDYRNGRNTASLDFNLG